MTGEMEKRFKSYAVTQCFQEPPVEVRELAIGFASSELVCQWVRIESEDDLPKEAADYFWFRRDVKYPVMQSFNPITDQVAGFVEVYAAWMPIPPFSEEKL